MIVIDMNKVYAASEIGPDVGRRKTSTFGSWASIRVYTIKRSLDLSDREVTGKSARRMEVKIA
jgi:hypothetical protein